MLKNEKTIKIVYLIIVALAVVSLFFSYTNKIFLSPLICTCIIFVPYLLLKKDKIETITKVLLVIFIYFAVATILYNVGSLFQFDFYRRDGNFFITFAPVLILSLVVFKCDSKKIMSTFLWVETIFNLICMIGFAFFGESKEYFFLFHAHNAAGGFITTILAFAIVKYIVEKDKKDLVIIIVNLIALIMTESRGSLIGLILGGISFIIYYKTKFKNADIVLFSMCTVGILFISGIVMSFIGKDVLKDDGNNFELPVVFENTIVEDALDLINRSHTIVNRVFYLWPRAMYLFTVSPIIGTGFGSFNDLPYDLKTVIPYLITRNDTESVTFSDSHAHNSYLHILAENGIIGFVFVLGMLFIFRREILKIEDKTLRYGLYFMLLTIVFSSFTEHRLFTPSQVLPFTILFGLALCEENYLKSKKKDEELIIINGRFLTQKTTGVQRYAREVTKELDKMDKNIIMFTPKSVQEADEIYKNIKISKIGILTGHLWEQLILPLYVMKYKIFYNVKFINLCNVAPILCPGYVTLHDMGFKSTSQHLNSKFAMWYKFITYMNIKRYKKIFTVSEFSKSEILKYYNVDPNNIIVTYNAAEHIKLAKPKKDVLKNLGLENKEFYFSLGSKSPHKNHAFIEKLAAKYPEKTFVVSGNANKVFKDSGEQMEHELKNLIYTGYISDDEMIVLYKNCEAFIFPSIYEGFGIPPLEAMVVGCKKIILSDIEVFREIFGDSATYVDTKNADDIDLDSIEAKNNVEEIISKYTWENVAKKVVENL